MPSAWILHKLFKGNQIITLCLCWKQSPFTSAGKRKLDRLKCISTLAVYGGHMNFIWCAATGGGAGAVNLRWNIFRCRYMREYREQLEFRFDVQTGKVIKRRKFVLMVRVSLLLLNNFCWVFCFVSCFQIHFTDLGHALIRFGVCSRSEREIRFTESSITPRHQKLKVCYILIDILQLLGRFIINK